MLSELGSIPIVNLLILRRLPKQVKRIYIDSFTILSFALGLRAELTAFSQELELGDTSPAIQNFRSYDDAVQPRFPADENYIVLISASTSGNLAEKLITENGASRNKIVHLLGTSKLPTNEVFRRSCLYFHTHRYDQSRSPLTNQTIAIVSEEFAVTHGRTRPVRIGLPHIDPLQAKLYSDPFYLEYLQLTPTGEAKGYGPSSVFVLQSETTLGSNTLYNWLQTELVHDLPSSANYVIHLENPRSVYLAEEVIQLLCANRTSATPQKISLDKLHNIEIPNEESRSVVVVASEDPNLEGLTRATIGLRKSPKVFRHYVLAHAFPESMQRHKRMIADLTMTTGSSKYGWSQFVATAVGQKSVHESIFADYGTSLNPTTLASWKDDLGSNRYDALMFRCCPPSQIERWRPNIFFPRYNGTRLVLRPRSAFFEGNYGEISQATVYLAVAAALQRARERRTSSTSANPDECFDENPFVRAVISPVMFSRYSDGILQAAFLRALAREELDFSSDNDLSYQFREIVRSVLIQQETDSGEAALEFLASVASNKVSLKDEDKEAIVKIVRQHKTLNAWWTIFSSGQNSIF